MCLIGLTVEGNVVSGPANDYVILSGNIPVHYSLVRAMPGSYIGLYQQGSNDKIAQVPVQQVNEGGCLKKSLSRFYKKRSSAVLN